MGIIVNQSSGGAGTTLGNLGTTSINTDLLPDGDGTRNLGSVILAWNDVHAVAIAAVAITASESIRLQEVTSSPGSVSGTGFLYTKSDNLLYWKDGDGNERVVDTSPPP